MTAAVPSEIEVFERVGTIEKADRLRVLEDAIDEARYLAVEAVWQIGRALLEIRDGRLYRLTHGNFEDYTRERWQMSRCHAYRLIDCAIVAARLSPAGCSVDSTHTDHPLPTHERHIRFLKALSPDVQAEFWRVFVGESAATGQELTGPRIEAAVAAVANAPPDEFAARINAASTPKEQRQVARAVLKEERLSARATRREERLADLEIKTAHVELSTLIDLRLADVASVIPTVRGAMLTHADAPWPYRNTGVNGAADGHYEKATMDHIVRDVDAAFDAAADDTYLLFWVTYPVLVEWIVASHLAIRWRYLTGGAWGKLGPIGSGFHWRGDAEALLVYGKGKPAPFDEAAVSNLFTSEREEHSEKPVEWLTRLVPHFAAPGLVFDLWAGKAPLARACQSLGRPYVGAEIDPDRHREALLLLAGARQLSIEEAT